MMKKIKFLVYFLLFFNSLYAQSFTASTDFASVPINQSFDVVYELKGAKTNRFVRPDFEPFRVVGQQSYSGGGMTVIINNKVVQDGSASQKWIFTLLPTKVGTFTVPPAKVLVDDKWIESNSLTIKITQAGSSTPNSSQSSMSNVKPNKSENISQNYDDEIFLRAEVNKSNVYLGEPVILNYYIYTRVDVRQYSINKTPSFKGFWSENLMENNKNAKITETTINGKRYMEAHIRSIALYPQETGNLKIDPLEVEAIIVRPVATRDPFDIFDKFFNDPFNFDPFSMMPPSLVTQPEKITLKSNPIQIQVKPLPSGAPPSFSNAVGNFTVDASLENDRCFLGESIVYNLIISGNGNLPLINSPQLSLSDNFQVFDPEIEDAFIKSITGISGTRTFKYIINPLNSGIYNIPSIEFSFFSVSSGKYITLKTPEFNIQVFDPSNANRNAQTAITNLKDDIQYINTIKNLSIFDRLIFNKLFAISLYIIPLIIIIIIAIFYRKRLKILNNFTLQKQKKADREARKRLKYAYKYLQENNSKQFFDQILSALWQFISDKYVIPISKLNIDNAREIMKEHNVDDTVIDELLSFINECQMYAYAPTSFNVDLKKFYKRAYEFIRKKI